MSMSRTRKELISRLLIDDGGPEMEDLGLCLNENCPEHRGGRVPHYLVVRLAYAVGQIGAHLYYRKFLGVNDESRPTALREFIRRDGEFAGPCGGINVLLDELEEYLNETDMVARGYKRG